MKVKEGYVLRKIAGQNVVVALGDGEMDFNRLITLNDTGAYLWERLVTGATEADLVAALLAEYDVDEATAARDVTAFLDSIRQAGLSVE